MDAQSNCINCGTALQGRICHVCGQEVVTGRWSTPVLVRQFINHLTNIEKGFLYTATVLFTSPGIVVRDYWKGKTIRYYHPFRYVIIWTAISVLISLWLGIDDLLQQSLQPESMAENIGEDRMAAADQKTDSWLQVLVLMVLPVSAYITLGLFRSHGQNYAEHLILNSFLLGQAGIIGSLTQVFFYLIPSLFILFLPFSFLVGLAYNSYVLHRVFGEPLGRTVLKAFGLGIVNITLYFSLVAIAAVIAIAITG